MLHFNRKCTRSFVSIIDIHVHVTELCNKESQVIKPVVSHAHECTLDSGIPGEHGGQVVREVECNLPWRLRLEKKRLVSLQTSESECQIPFRLINVFAHKHTHTHHVCPFSCESGNRHTDDVKAIAPVPDGERGVKILESTRKRIFETPVGLDPDFRFQRTLVLGLTRVKGNSDFRSDQSPSLAQLLVLKTESPESQMNWVPGG